MNIQTELDTIFNAEKPLRELEATLVAELAEAERQRLTPTTRNGRLNCDWPFFTCARVCPRTTPLTHAYGPRYTPKR